MIFEQYADDCLVEFDSPSGLDGIVGVSVIPPPTGPVVPFGLPPPFGGGVGGGVDEHTKWHCPLASRACN